MCQCKNKLVLNIVFNIKMNVQFRLPDHSAMHGNPRDEFIKWRNHYESYLEQMYLLFQDSCYSNSVNWDQYVGYNIFCAYIYENSSGYLSPWV